MHCLTTLTTHLFEANVWQQNNNNKEKKKRGKKKQSSSNSVKVGVLYYILNVFLFSKVAVPDGCEYVPLVKKATKPAKVGY